MPDPVERVRSPFARGAASEAPASVEVPALMPRATTGYEEDLVLRNRAASPVWLCNEVLARCLVPPGDDPGDERRAVIRALPIAVRDRLLIELRRRSFGDRMEVQTACPKCSEKVEATLDLAQLPLDAPAAPPVIEEVLSDGTMARARLPTAGDQEALAARSVDNEAERRTSLLALLVERLGDRVGPVPTAAIHALPSKDRMTLERRIDGETPMLDLSLGLACPACAHAWAAPIEVTSFFLTS